jgi:hypothetical protein
MFSFHTIINNNYIYIYILCITMYCQELTGANQPIHGANCSPGYQHDEYWPTVLQRIAARDRESRDSPGNFDGILSDSTPVVDSSIDDQAEA